MERRLVEQRRVVVTGIGLISPVGIATEETWASILQGQSGIGKITLFDAKDHLCKIEGEVKDFHPEAFIARKEVKKTSRFCQFAIADAEIAVRHTNFVMANEDSHRVGVHVGSGFGGFESSSVSKHGLWKVVRVVCQATHDPEVVQSYRLERVGPPLSI